MTLPSEYVSHSELLKASKGIFGDCVVYKHSGDIRSVVFRDKVIKSPDRILAQSDNETLAMVKHISRDKGLPLPGSFAAITKLYLQERRLSKTCLDLFKYCNSSPWMKSFDSCVSPAISYDLNRAYWSSVATGMPVKESIRYPEHTEKWDIAYADIAIPQALMPPPFDKAGVKRVAISRDDADRFGIQVLRIHYCISFQLERQRYIDAIGTVYEQWGDLVARKCSQCLWGRWGKFDIVIESIKNGTVAKRSRVPNQFHDPIRMYLASHRVREKLYDAFCLARNPGRVWVDNILAQSVNLPVGTEPGTWRKCKEWQQVKILYGGSRLVA